MLSPMIKEVSHYVNIDTESLISQGIRSFLTDKKKSILLERLNILLRYHVISKEELERGIEAGIISEHPAWEDLITVENLESEAERIDGYLGNL